MTVPQPSRFKKIPIEAGLMLLEAILIIGYIRQCEASEQDRLDAAAHKAMLETNYVLDGCQYRVDNRDWPNSLVHLDSCRNPIHWSEVLSDTSWWHKVREKRRGE
jgi:hypothetical protein